MTSKASRRFADTTLDEIEKKRLRLNSENTIKCNNKCANILRDYLKEKQQHPGFETYDCVQLNEMLAHFYVDLRKPDGSRYKATSFESIRSGLNRYLRSPPHNKKFDIVKDPCFNDANTNFRAQMAEIKRMGLAIINHHPVINETDRMKLYSSILMNPETPLGLANKVQFDIRLYFFRRGMENMEKMKKTDFTVENNPKTLQKYVIKTKDELTKNHRENDKENYSGVMPESPGSPYCPVASFERYLGKLHPSNERLWQRPLDSFLEEDAWFRNSAIGSRTLSNFMSKLSKDCKLSQIYTNHSIRATGATILSKNMYGAAQIMAVTGHKSVQSLTTYQRVDTEEKIKMGQTITQNVCPVSQPLALPSSERVALSTLQMQSLPPGTIVQDLLPIGPETTQNMSANPSATDYLRDINLDELLNDFTGPVQNNSCTTTQSTCNHATYTRPQIFYGNVTVIQNLTINKS